MDVLNFSDNIVRLRHKKNITQEQLAEFIGVTKASVSKWENKQSLPDILLLPKLAAFFDVSIDELIGYEPQLSKEQIQRLYHELASAFAEKPFEEVMKKSQELVKKYYSCYPFLFYIGCLWVNHFMLAKSKVRQEEILNQTSDLYSHIIDECKDIGICNNAVILKSIADLQLGRIEEVIEKLEEILNPNHMMPDAVLIQAYQMNGQKDKANNFTQISMFSHLIALIEGAVNFIAIHTDNIVVCEATVKRMDSLFEAYDIEKLNPNAALQFYYQSAIIYCQNNEKDKALERLEKYADCVKILLFEDGLFLHGDSYFDSIESSFEQLDLGRHAPRDRKVIADSAVEIFSNSAFTVLNDSEKFKRIKQSLFMQMQNEDFQK